MRRRRRTGDPTRAARNCERARERRRARTTANARRDARRTSEDARRVGAREVAALGVREARFPAPSKHSRPRRTSHRRRHPTLDESEPTRRVCRWFGARHFHEVTFFFSMTGLNRPFRVHRSVASTTWANSERKKAIRGDVAARDGSNDVAVIEMCFLSSLRRHTMLDWPFPPLVSPPRARSRWIKRASAVARSSLPPSAPPSFVRTERPHLFRRSHLFVIHVP